MEEKETRFDRSTERSECLIAEYKKLRKDEAKMSQKSLEDITGVPRQMIIRYEKGKIMPTVRAMNRLLEPLGYLALGVLCHAVNEHVRTRINENRAAHLVIPIVIVRKAP